MKSLLGLFIFISFSFVTAVAQTDTFLFPSMLSGPTFCHSIDPVYNSMDCPSFYSDQRRRYLDEERLSGTIPMRQCQVEFNLITHSPLETDQTFFNNPSLRFGQIPLAVAFSGCYSDGRNHVQNVLPEQIGERQPHIEEGPQNTLLAYMQSSFAERSLTVSQREAENIMVTEHYYSHLRLRTGIEEGLKSLNLIDSVLEQEQLTDQNCIDFDYQQTNTLCQRLKDDSCQTRATAHATKAGHVSLTKRVLLKSKEIEMQLDVLINRQVELYENLGFIGGQYGRDRNSRIDAINDEINVVENQIDALSRDLEGYRAMAPWVDQSAFSNSLNHTRLESLIEDGNEEAFEAAISEAYDQQLRENREVVANQVRQLQEGVRCLNLETNCSRDEVDNYLDLAPHPDTSGLPFEGNFEFLKCLQQSADDIEQRRQFRRDLAIAGGLTIASFLIPPVGYVRGLAAVGAAVRTTGGAARLAANAIMLGADATYAIQSFQDAARECSGDTGQLEFDRPRPSQQNQSCQELNSEIQSRVNFEPDNCLGAALFAGIDAIPLASFASMSLLREARLLRSGNGPARSIDPEDYADLSRFLPEGAEATGDFSLRLAARIGDGSSGELVISPSIRSHLDDHILEHNDPEAIQQIVDELFQLSPEEMRRRIGAASGINLEPGDQITRRMIFSYIDETIGVRTGNNTTTMYHDDYPLERILHELRSNPTIEVTPERSFAERLEHFDRLRNDTSISAAERARAADQYDGFLAGGTRYEFELDGIEYAIHICRRPGGCGSGQPENGIMTVYPRCGRGPNRNIFALNTRGAIMDYLRVNLRNPSEFNPTSVIGQTIDTNTPRPSNAFDDGIIRQVNCVE